MKLQIVLLMLLVSAGIAYGYGCSDIIRPASDVMHTNPLEETLVRAQYENVSMFGHYDGIHYNIVIQNITKASCSEATHCAVFDQTFAYSAGGVFVGDTCEVNANLTGFSDIFFVVISGESGSWNSCRNTTATMDLSHTNFWLDSSNIYINYSLDAEYSSDIIGIGSTVYTKSACSSYGDQSSCQGDGYCTWSTECDPLNMHGGCTVTQDLFLDISGSPYTVSDNPQGIIVSGSGVTIDCNSSTLVCNTSTNSNCINVNAQDVIVKNCNIDDSWRGIRFQDSSLNAGNRVEGCTVKSRDYAVSGNVPYIGYSVMSSRTNYAVNLARLTDAMDSVFEHNTVYNSSRAMQVQNCTDLSISDNIFYSFTIVGTELNIAGSLINLQGNIYNSSVRSTSQSPITYSVATGLIESNIFTTDGYVNNLITGKPNDTVIRNNEFLLDGTGLSFDNSVRNEFYGNTFMFRGYNGTQHKAIGGNQYCINWTIYDNYIDLAGIGAPFYNRSAHLATGIHIPDVPRQSGTFEIYGNTVANAGNMTWYAERTQNGLGIAIQCSNATCWVHDNLVENVSDRCIGSQVRSANDLFHVYNNSCINSAGGLNCQFGGTCIFEGNEVVGDFPTYSQGIRCQNATCTIRNNHIKDKMQGIVLVGANGAHVHNNLVENMMSIYTGQPSMDAFSTITYGFFNAESNGTNAHDNQFIGSVNNMTYFRRSKSIIFNDNEITNPSNPYSAIALDSSEDLSITGNTADYGQGTLAWFRNDTGSYPTLVYMSGNTVKRFNCLQGTWMLGDGNATASTFSDVCSNYNITSIPSIAFLATNETLDKAIIPQLAVSWSASTVTYGVGKYKLFIDDSEVSELATTSHTVNLTALSTGSHSFKVQAYTDTEQSMVSSDLPFTVTESESVVMYSEVNSSVDTSSDPIITNEEIGVSVSFSDANGTGIVATSLYTFIPVAVQSPDILVSIVDVYVSSGITGTVRITQSYSQPLLPSAVSESSLALYAWYDGVWNLGTNQELDTLSNIVSADFPADKLGGTPFMFGYFGGTTYVASDLPAIALDVAGEAGHSLKVNIPLLMLGVVALFISGIILAIRARFR
jgi:hypothetical protein